MIFAALGLLALLDLGRSLNANYGFQEPAEIWQPDPDAYADIAWPPGSSVPPSAPLGEKVYSHNDLRLGIVRVLPRQRRSRRVQAKRRQRIDLRAQHLEPSHRGHRWLVGRADRAGRSIRGQPIRPSAVLASHALDHFSSFDEEDLVALVAYLRLLPPVAQAVPPYRPPAPDDCKVYTFWTSRNLASGCK